MAKHDVLLQRDGSSRLRRLIDIKGILANSVSVSWLHVQPSQAGRGTCVGPRMQGNGAGDKMCTRCGWTPDVCKVIQHVASAEAALGSFATRVPPEFLSGFRWGWQNLVPPQLSQDHREGLSPHRPEHSSEPQGRGGGKGFFLIPRSPCRLCSG